MEFLQQHVISNRPLDAPAEDITSQCALTPLVHREGGHLFAHSWYMRVQCSPKLHIVHLKVFLKTY